MGAIIDPPPTPVRPTSAPTPNPAAQLIQFKVMSTLVVYTRVGYRPDGHRYIPYERPSELGASHYADSAAVSAEFLGLSPRRLRQRCVVDQRLGAGKTAERQR